MEAEILSNVPSLTKLLNILANGFHPCKNSKNIFLDGHNDVAKKIVAKVPQCLSIIFNNLLSVTDNILYEPFP